MEGAVNVDGIPKGGQIRELGDQLSRQICTGQIVISLAGACRELVDNALDAGATNIEIRTIENGVDALEVIDNGSGISPSNFDHLCKPHCTSKLYSIEDFQSLTSFGFRGEALNALASLSDVQIVTCDSSSRCATRLIFDRSGDCVSTEHCPRSQGTTVRIGNLFTTLPVRRQEFKRQSRREFLRLVDYVQAFALARTDCRFTCSNTVNGKRSLILSTPGGTNTLLPDVLSNLFGGIGRKGCANLLPLDEVSVPDKECRQIYGLNTDVNASQELVYSQIRLSGFVSNCEPGNGRSSADRQFIFVNRRHLEFPKLCRIANEVYALYNRGRYCLLVLFVDVPPHTLDVNISPDKRTVFLHHEKEVFAKLRASLLATFSRRQGACQITGPLGQQNGALGTKRSQIGTLLRWKDTMDENNGTEEAELINESDGMAERCLPLQTQQSADLSYLAFEELTQNEDPELTAVMTDDEFDRIIAIADHKDQDTAESAFLKNHSDETNSFEVIDDDSARIGPRQKRSRTDPDKTPCITRATRQPVSAQKALEAFSFQCLRSAAAKTILKERNSSVQREPLKAHSEIIATQPEVNTLFYQVDGNEVKETGPSSSPVPGTSTSTTKSSDVCPINNNNPEAMFYRPQQTVQVNMQLLERNFLRRCDLLKKKAKQRRTANEGMKLKVTSCNRTKEEEDQENEAIERRLSLMLQKSDFAQMHLIGQFNNAFIIARLRSDVFIIDQHAADEKFNFERHLANYVIKSQRLIRPQRLQLGSVNEALLRDNLHVFNANGFEFEFREQNTDIIMEDGTEEHGSTVSLTAVPVHHGWQLNGDDIDQLLSMLAEMPGMMHRPVKVRKIFASKACRHSTMFGKALTRREMETIIRNMGTMDQPWNCPHGRPTIRHLCTVEKK